MFKQSKKKEKLSSKRINSEDLHRKTLVMVILQCFLMIMSRVPDVLLSLCRIRLQMTKNFQNERNDLTSKLNLLAPLETYYIILTNFSYLQNFFINLIFNKKFHEPFLGQFFNKSKPNKK